MMTVLISAVVGGFLSVAFIIGSYKVLGKEQWEQYELEMLTHRQQAYTATAENAKLRVALAAGEMTEDGKKVAAMTMAALDAAIGADKVE